MTSRPRQRHRIGKWAEPTGTSRVLCGLLATVQLLLPTLAPALPTDGQVAAGQATIQQATQKTLTIQQTTEKAILNWKSFSIAADEAVRFAQPSVHSIALNRVLGVDPSIILGRLEANGRLFLINPNGILFGAGSRINVGSLLATTLQMRDEDFMAGRYLFAQDPLKGLKSVVNRGAIHVSDHGFVLLAAPAVSNEGIIVANVGTTLLGSGQKMTLDLMGDGLIQYALSEKVLDKVMGPDGQPVSSAVSNSGTIQADGGQVILQAKAASEVFSSVVNQSGIIRARSLENHGGVVQLLGGDEALVAATAAGAMRPAGEVSGAVVNTGTIDVSAREPHATPGTVTIAGERVGHFGSILATGAGGANGGEVVIGSTAKSLLAGGSLVDVSGGGHSSGGRLTVWSDQDTFFNNTASILALGGEQGGNGGFVELSAKEALHFAGTVNALAPFGSAGTLLLDPRNITIAAAGAAYNPGSNNLFGNTPAADVTISTASINAAAANVVLQANNDITVGSAINMANNGVGITMQAGRDVNVNAAITTTNGHISMTANDSSAVAANRLAGTGDIVFGAAGNLNAGSGNIVLNVGPSAAVPFSPGSVTTVRNLTTTTGNIAITSPNTVSLSGTINAGSGTVNINANSDGAGAQGFTMNAGSSIATTNTGANAVQIVVNSPAGGTGAASLRGSIATGNGGTATVSTRGQAAAGGNTTGGAITQGAVLTMNSGAAGTIALATGAAASSITLNTVGNDFVGTVGVSRAFNVALRDANALTLGASTIAGTLGVTTAGAVTQNGALTVAGTTTLAAGAANDITLSNAANNFSTISITNGRNVVLRDANALILGTSTISGALGVTTSGALTQSGALTVAGTSTLAAGTANNITLNNAANNFSTVGITSGNNVTLRDANTLDLGASAVAGTLSLTTAGALTQSGALAVTGATTVAAGAGNDITLNAANDFSTLSITSGRNVTGQDINGLNVGTSTISGNVALTVGGTVTQSGVISVGGITSITATVPNTDILLASQANNVVGALTFGGTLGNIRDVALRNTNAGTIVPPLGALVNLRNLTLIFNNAPIVLPSLTLAAGGSLTATAGGAISQTGTLVIPGATILAAGSANNITLNNAGNDFGTLAVTSGNNVSLRDANALVLGASTVSGTLNVTTSGALTQSGALTAAGITTLAAGATNNITLNNAANNFGTVAVTSGNNVNLRDTNALTLGASTISGTLAVTTAGALTQSGALTVAGTTTLAAGTANNITLNNAANNFSTVGITSGNNVVLTDVNALNLAASSVSGTLGVTTSGALTQSGGLRVTGTTTLATGAANDIALNNAANNFSRVGITSGNNVTLADANALILGASTVSGALNVAVNGALTQSGAMTATGATILAAGAGNDITLANAGNNFSTLGISSGRNVTLRDSGSLVLGASTVSGSLALTTGGSVTQSGTLAVTGTTSFTATAANTDILLATQANNLGGAISFGGTLPNFRDVHLRNVNAGAAVPSLAGLTNLRNLTLTYDSAPITLPALTLTAGGHLNVTAGGPITDSGNVIVPGTSTLAAGGNNITLDNGNDFTGPVFIASGNNVTLNDINALVFGPSTITGTLNVTTAGPISQTGAVAVGGASTLGSGTANDITLNNAANDFSTVGITSGNNVVITDANTLNLGTSTVSGALDVTTNGSLTQSGGLAVAGATTVAAGPNDITLTNAGNNFGTVGITSGNQVALADANAITLNASTISGNFSANAADLTVGGAVSSTGGSLNLAAANQLTQLANLTVNGANAVTVTASGGPLTMAAGARTSSGTGSINYTAGMDVTLGSLRTGGGVNVVATGGSVLSAGGAGTNVTAGANSAFQAFNGVVGTQAAPVTVNVNPGTLSIRATTAPAGISAFLTGAVLPGNAVTVLNVPPGAVCFNGCPIPPSNGIGPFSTLTGGVFGYLNRDTIVPSYYIDPSGVTQITNVTAEYVPGTVVVETPVTVEGGAQSVAREIPPCYPASACKPGATILTVPADEQDPELPAAK